MRDRQRKAGSVDVTEGLMRVPFVFLRDKADYYENYGVSDKILQLGPFVCANSSAMMNPTFQLLWLLSAPGELA